MILFILYGEELYIEMYPVMGMSHTQFELKQTLRN